MSTLFSPMFLAEEFHDIAPPINYSLIPPWVIATALVAGLVVVGVMVWLIVRRLKPSVPPKSPQERALEELALLHDQLDVWHPYQFSIRVSDILRRYVTEQFQLPVTRQTSVEFLEGLRKRCPFSDSEKALLEHFLSRCDLIKFARYEATMADSEMLLDEATDFVKGGQLVVA